MQPIEGGFRGYGLFAAMAGQARLGDRELEMLGHAKALDDSANPEGDGLPAAEWPAGTLGGCRDLAQLLLGGGQQLLTFAGTLISQERVRQTTKRSPGNCPLRSSVRLRSSNSDSWIGPCSAISWAI